LNKYSKIAIVGGMVLLLVALLYFFGFRQKNDTYITDDWSMTYDPADKGPYGTYMLKELLDTTGLFGNFLELDDNLEEILEDDPDVNDIYFFVGGENYLSDSSTNFLMDFIRSGNTGFISTEEFPYTLLNLICYDPEDIFAAEVIDSSQFFKFSHNNFEGKRYEFKYINNNKIQQKTWDYFDVNAFYLYEDNDTLSSLGSNNHDQVNFIKIRYGEGQLFLHSNPYVFTNVSMMKRDGFQYAENVLKHVPPGRVQWDKYNLRYHRKQSSGNEDDGGGDGEKRESILQFIMNNPPLLWAFLILLIGGVLYALFKGKRMQKIVPPSESKENMSLQYINTLSSLYLQEKKHNKLIKLKEKTFLNFIAERYYIHSNKLDDKFFTKVASKSHIPKEDIIDIFKTFNRLERTPEVSDQALIQLHQKIENFYKNCR
jgi:hypothetical protein